MSADGIDGDRTATIAELRRALKARSGKTWSVTGGRGTSWGWIEINVPPKLQERPGTMTIEQRAELAQLLGLDDVHRQGLMIPASSAYRREYLDRANGRTPSVIAEPYWD